MYELAIHANGRIALGRDILAISEFGQRQNRGGKIPRWPDRIEGRTGQWFKRDDGPTLSIDEINKVIAKGWASAGTVDEQPLGRISAARY